MRPPDLIQVRDVFFAPLRPTPPPPPPVRPTKVVPPTLIPQPGLGTGIAVIDPPPIVDAPPSVPQPGAVRIETERGGGVPSVGIDREPIPFVRVDPDYPPRALMSETEGWVQVQFAITPTGTVKNAQVVAAEPRGVFDDAALKAIARWRYNPKIESGVPVERVGLQTIIRFQLSH